MLAGHQAAATYNAKRTKQSEKVWNWMDLHPHHFGDRKRPATGKQVIAAVAMMGSGEWEFAPGYDWKTIMGN